MLRYHLCRGFLLLRARRWKSISRSREPTVRGAAGVTPQTSPTPNFMLLGLNFFMSNFMLLGLNLPIVKFILFRIFLIILVTSNKKNLLEIIFLKQKNNY